MIMVCGEALFDVFMLPFTGALLNLQAVRGGSPYNVAVGLARLGEVVGFFGGLSRDPLGEILRRSLEEEGVKTDLAPLVVAPTTLAMVQLDASGLPKYAFYGENAADRQLELNDIPSLADDVKALHFGSFSLVVAPSGQTLRAFAQLHAGKRLISYDPNIRPTVIADMDVWRTNLQDWLMVADLIKVSQEDLALLYPGQDPVEIIRSWLNNMPSLVVLTQGEKGAVGVNRQGIVHVPAVEIAVMDTVGAGDSFQSALLHGLNQHGAFEKSCLEQLSLKDLKDILQFSVFASGMTCTRKGADLPYARELL